MCVIEGMLSSHLPDIVSLINDKCYESLVRLKTASQNTTRAKATKVGLVFYKLLYSSRYPFVVN